MGLTLAELQESKAAVNTEIIILQHKIQDLLAQRNAIDKMIAGELNAKSEKTTEESKESGDS